MNNYLNEKIIDFFDELAIDRDSKIKSDPIVDYEQRMRLTNIISLLRPDPEEIILDIGCGDCRDAGIILRYYKDLNYVGVDISFNMLREANNKNIKMHLARGSILSLPFKNKTFDKVICSEVLEHVPAWKEAVGELRRVLRDSGAFILSTPNTLSVYYPQRLILEKRKGKAHPYDEWKNYFILRRSLMWNGFQIRDVKGSCYLPGLIAYGGRIKKIVTRYLPQLEQVEKKVLSRTCMKYFGYTIMIKAVKSKRILKRKMK